MPAPDLTIRPARPEDAPRLAELDTQLGYPATAADIARRLQALQPQPRHAVFVAEAGKIVVGWMHLFVITSLLTEREIEVEGLVVDADWRGRGVGKALIGQAERWARERGCASIYLRSNTLRGEAHQFYEGLGFEKVKSQFAFRKRLP